MRTAVAVSLLASLLFCSVNVIATAQRGDELILDGKRYTIFTNPLEPLLSQYPERRPKSKTMSTALWRGYVATWEVKNDQLFLTDVGTPTEKWSELKSVMSQMYPDQKLVLADWFTGNIIIPDGEQVHYVHMGYASEYERYIVLSVVKGAVKQKLHLNLKEFRRFREKQFECFKHTEEYRKAVTETAKEGGLTPAQNEEFIREYFSEQYLSAVCESAR